jgi:hypothetical protein
LGSAVLNLAFAEDDMANPVPPNAPGGVTSWFPTGLQVDAAMRHVYTSGASVFTVLSVFALLPSDQVQPAIDALHRLGDDIKALMGDLSALWIILGPVVIGFVAKAAAFSASLRSQLKAVTQNKQVEIKGEIVVPKDVADAVPSPQVVSK